MLTGHPAFRKYARPITLWVVMGWLFCFLAVAHVSSVSSVYADPLVPEVVVSHGHHDADEHGADCCELQMTAVKPLSLDDLLPDTLSVAIALILLWWWVRAIRLPLAVAFSPPAPSGQRRHLLFCNFRH